MEVPEDTPDETVDEDSIGILESVLKELLKSKGEVTRIENGNSILVQAYSIRDKSFFVALLKQCNDHDGKLPVNLYQSLLKSIVEDGEWNILMKLLDKCEHDRTNENFYVELSLSIIQKDTFDNQMDIFKKVVRKLFPENGFINDRETFLTYVIKCGIKEEDIIMLVTSRCFDVNLPNSDQETPLTLVCQRLMIEATKVLLQYGSDVTYNNTSVVKVIMQAIQTCDQEDRSKASDILKLLIEPRKDLSIPDDNENGTVFENEYWPAPTGSKKMIIDMIKFLVAHRGDISKTSNTRESILSLAYKLPDKRLFSMLVENCEKTLSLTDNEAGQRLLTSIVSDKFGELLVKVLNKCEISDNVDHFLLSLALTLLKQSDSGIYRLILHKCSNLNMVLTNGENFLTTLFKENVSESLIVAIVELKLFDLNVPNSLGETPLILACERLRAEVVSVLLLYGSDLSLDNYRAIEVTIKACEGSPEKIDAKNKVMEQFFCAQRSQSVHIQTNESDFDSDTQEPALLSYYPTTTIPNRRTTKTSFFEMFIFALFAKTDYVDYLFNWKSNVTETDFDAKKLKEFLLTQIVHILRKNGVIDGRKICYFVGRIKVTDMIPLLKEREMDIKDLVLLFSKLFPGANLLSLVKPTSDASFYISLLVQTSQPLLTVSVQDLLSVYMLQEKNMFVEIPAFLILQIPRHRKGFGNYNNIIPSSVIDISDFLVNSYKTCCKCNKEAIFRCHKCVEMHSYTVKHGFSCSGHKCSHRESNSLPSSTVKSKSPVQMSLQSVICYERDYFVAFTKHSNQDNKWLFFSSVNGPNIPTTTSNDRVSQFLHLPDVEMRNMIFGRVPLYLRQILCDSYIFMYQNSTVTCY